MKWGPGYNPKPRSTLRGSSRSPFFFCCRYRWSTPVVLFFEWLHERQKEERKKKLGGGRTNPRRPKRTGGLMGSAGGVRCPDSQFVGCRQRDVFFWLWRKHALVSTLSATFVKWCSPLAFPSTVWIFCVRMELRHTINYRSG